MSTDIGRTRTVVKREPRPRRVPVLPDEALPGISPAPVRDPQPGVARRLRERAAVDERWARGEEIARRPDVRASADKSAAVQRGFEVLCALYARVEETPDDAFCPDCQGWLLRGTQYPCIDHAEPIVRAAIEQDHREGRR